jgi:uncharacterized membrane protein YgcG
MFKQQAAQPHQQHHHQHQHQPHVLQQHQQVNGLALLQPHLAPSLQAHTWQQLQDSAGQQDMQPPLHAVSVAGAVAGVALSVILSPTELVKCRMQVGQHTSPIACLQAVVRTEGAWGLARGLRATLCREVPGNALFFTVYEGLRRSWLGGRPTGHGSSSSSGGAGEGSRGVASSGSGGNGSSGSTLSAAWAVARDAGGAIMCGGLAGIVVSPLCNRVHQIVLSHRCKSQFERNKESGRAEWPPAYS